MRSVSYARRAARSPSWYVIVLYNARRIVYGVQGDDATRVRPDAIAITRGPPGASGVL
jgi:hypothetical protein